jgi:hypothetical protein
VDDCDGLELPSHHGLRAGSRKTLNDWQRKSADLQKQDESARGKKTENEVGKQAER